MRAVSKLLALSFWLLAYTAFLFTLATDIWAGIIPLWQFVGAIALGVIGPSGTWAIAKRYPETSWLAWLLLWMMAGVVATIALLWFVALLGA
jgi:hypothetical protein